MTETATAHRPDHPFEGRGHKCLKCGDARFVHPANVTRTISIPDYGEIQIGALEVAAFESIAESEGTDAERVAEVFGPHDVFSDAFYSAWDAEILRLVNRFRKL